MIVDFQRGAHRHVHWFVLSILHVFSVVGPNVNGSIQLTGDNYNVIMLIAPVFMLIALWLMLGVKRGEAVQEK